jgi:predicted kinase
MEKHLFLLRGLPGAGKSTLAKSIGGLHFEADMYFVDTDGNYNFDATKLRDAHDWCKRKVYNGMTVLNQSRIIVSNTFTQEWEMKAYFDLAEQHGYTVFSLIVENRHGGINAHEVPQEALDKMKDRFEVKL